jgi:hypothetical protein
MPEATVIMVVVCWWVHGTRRAPTSTGMHAQAPRHEHLLALLIVLVFLLGTASPVEDAASDGPGAGVGDRMSLCRSCVEGIP